MNLIEQLGGYQKALEHFKDHMRNPDNHDDGLGASLLEYRREHNIFEPGDAIECVNANDQRYLKPGQIYEVRKMDGHRLYVVGYQRFSFLSSRFKHAEPKQ